MSFQLIRKTANGDLQLDGLPVYIAGTVATVANLPQSGKAIGESYWVGSGQSKFLYIWNGDLWDCKKDSSVSINGNDAVALDAATINQTLLQTGFPTI
jgi:hypothetical protein